jgi:hypothetical protein
MLRRIRSIPGSKGCTGVQKAEENGASIEIHMKLLGSL